MISFSNTAKIEQVSSFDALKVKDNLYSVRNTFTETIDGVENGDPYTVEFMCDNEALEWYKKPDDSIRKGWVSDSALIMIDEDKVREQAYNTVNSRSFVHDGIAHSNVFDHFLAGGSSDNLIVYHSNMGMYMDDQGNYLARLIWFDHNRRITSKYYDLEMLSEILKKRPDIRDFCGPVGHVDPLYFGDFCSFVWKPSQEDHNKIVKEARRIHEGIQHGHSHPILYMDEALANLDILGLNSAWIHEVPLVEFYKRT